ncbi:thiol-disulfide isomerase [Candidatus Nanopelagicus abundans]|uniref:Thiol-disulfide isomerase n=1 Tax=Candidatus Nanopelagicus abundans TaxID=1884916 RepID=A0A249L5H3_9ACTN|nr:TlpA disulfide reductase family protein [Candidatus Nanopelagicus abundans]ASY24348.1 thiol-disulfide isomerase [Candidatus Nanopelagicus abundans]
MRKFSVFVITALLLSGCSTGEQSQTTALGVIPNCDQIDISKETSKELKLSCLDGSSEINYHSIKGPIVINVWASWCTGCKEEMPYFVDLYANPIFKSGEIKLLGIDVDEKNADSGPNFIKSHGMSWPHLEDTDSRSKLVFGPGVPVTYFLDKSGIVIHKHIGAYRSKSQLYEAVEKYFKVKL